MKFLVIGSHGFIGSHLAEYLGSLGHEVYGCDVVTDYILPHYFQVDASDPYYLEVFGPQQYDVCINCSGAAHVGDSFTYNHKDFILNTSNVYSLLDALKKTQRNCRFINLSSAAVYGNPKKLPIGEGHDCRPISPYGSHKLMAEKIIEEFRNYFGVHGTSLRIFSAYGQGLKKQLFWDLYRKMYGNDSIELFGTGEETRDFIHIDDLCTAILVVAEKNESFQVINVANGQQWSINAVVREFSKSMHWGGNISFSKKSKNGDPDFWVADIGVLSTLGYQQHISLDEGIAQYVSWIKELS